MTTRSALAVWTLALALAGAAIAIIGTSDHSENRLPTILLAVPTELVFVLSGLIARARRPDNRTGSLLIAVGLSWFLGALTFSDLPALHTAGLLLGSIFTAVLAHLLLAFPTGRLERRIDRTLAGTGYALVLGGPLLYRLFTPRATSCDRTCPENVVAVADLPGLADALQLAYLLAAVALLGILLARLGQRWRRASPALRRALAPVYAAGLAFLGGLALTTAVELVSHELAERFNVLMLAALLAVPLAFLYGLLRSRFGTTTRRIVAELSTARDPEAVQDVLRRALRDESLELGYRFADAYVDVHGEPFAPQTDTTRCVTPIGRQIIVHDATLRDQPELADVVDAAQIALERGLSLRTLAETERRAEALLEAIPDNVYRVARDGTFREAHANKRSAVFPPGHVYPGVPAESLVGQRVQDVMPEVAEPILRAVELALSEAGSATVEFPIETPVGRRELELRTAPSGPDDAVGVVRDVTERKRQEQALAALAAEQAALRHVAEGVAKALAPSAVFDVAAEEVARLLGADAANVVKFDESNDASAMIVGKWSAPGVPIGERGTIVPLGGGPITRVRESGVASRGRPDDPQNTDDLRERLEALGITSLVATPVSAGGRLWGALAVSRTDGLDFPDDSEERVAQFANLVEVAIANAEARDGLAALAEEQAALKRVALAVATESDSSSLFDLVSEEAGHLLGARSAATVRFVDDAEESIIVGGWTSDPAFPVGVGERLPFQGGAIERVARSGRPERVDVDVVDPDVRRMMERDEVASQVAAPIVVAGRIRGATSISIGPPHRFPAGAEDRLGQFTSIVSVALANAQARRELAALAQEQAALGRVAVAAATESPERLFDIVSEEVGRLFGARFATTSRFADDGSHVIVMGRWGEGHPVEVGARRELNGGVLTRVHVTARPARTDYPDEPEDVRADMRLDEVWSSVAAPIVVSGRLWGATAIFLVEPDVFPTGIEERLGKFTNLVAVALANAEAREQLTASRARIVEAGDEERRRLERNLHDGAQQRLVSLALTLRLAQSRVPHDPAAAAALLEQASAELALGLEELRELARGIHPAILTDRGLAPALEALADRASVPVRISPVPPGRLPPPVEAAAFYVVAESLTNVAKYARATAAKVDVARDDGTLVVEVSDDGVGGADPSRGSGLRGLADRVEALDGRLVVTSRPDEGTTVRAELPVDVPRHAGAAPGRPR